MLSLANTKVPTSGMSDSPLIRAGLNALSVGNDWFLFNVGSTVFQCKVPQLLHSPCPYAQIIYLCHATATGDVGGEVALVIQDYLFYSLSSASFRDIKWKPGTVITHLNWFLAFCMWIVVKCGVTVGWVEASIQPFCFTYSEMSLPC